MKCARELLLPRAMLLHPSHFSHEDFRVNGFQSTTSLRALSTTCCLVLGACAAVQTHSKATTCSRPFFRGDRKRDSTYALRAWAQAPWQQHTKTSRLKCDDRVAMLDASAGGPSVLTTCSTLSRASAQLLAMLHFHCASACAALGARAPTGACSRKACG